MNIKNSTKTHWPFLIFLTSLLVVGLFIADDYGSTIDDPGLREYGDHVMLIYGETLSGRISFDPGPANLRYYGPAFLTAEKLAENSIVNLFPHISRTTIWHFSIFVTHLIGIAALYSISLRLFDRNISLGIAVIYGTQPLLWGHAYINGKDIPLLGFFLLSIALGLRVESVLPARPKDRSNLWTSLKKDLSLANKNLHTRIKYIFAGLAAFTFVQVLVPAWPKSMIRYFIDRALASPDSLTGRLFYSWASNAATIPAENYVQKALAIIQVISAVILLLAWILFIILTIRALPKTEETLKRLAKSIPWERSSLYLKSPKVWAAGLSLATATAIRAVGPLAGVLVSIYLLAKKKLSALPTIVFYAIIAAVGTFALWPYLWSSPLQNFLNSFRVLTNFPQDNHQFLNGVLYSAHDLPFFFLPELLLIQFTLPAILLIIAGSIFIYINWGNSRGEQVLIGTLLSWFALPLLYSMLLRPTTYNNFRQWLFIVPPLFLIAGFGLRALTTWLQQSYRYWLIVALVSFSGIWSIAVLHPYEYVFYNSIVGGLRGAARSFELDYWATALREATNRLNLIAPTDSKIVVWAASREIVSEVARDDLLVERNRGGTYDVMSGYDFAVINLGPTRDVSSPYPDAKIVILIARETIPLAIVKETGCECNYTSYYGNE